MVSTHRLKDMALVITIVSQIIIYALLTRIDLVLDGQLYNYTLRFSPEWAGTYTTYLWTIYACLILPIALSTITLTISLFNRIKNKPQNAIEQTIKTVQPQNKNKIVFPALNNQKLGISTNNQKTITNKTTKQENRLRPPYYNHISVAKTPEYESKPIASSNENLMKKPIQEKVKTSIPKTTQENRTIWLSKKEPIHENPQVNVPKKPTLNNQQLSMPITGQKTTTYKTPEQENKLLSTPNKEIEKDLLLKESQITKPTNLEYEREPTTPSNENLTKKPIQEKPQTPVSKTALQENGPISLPDNEVVKENPQISPPKAEEKTLTEEAAIIKIEHKEKITCRFCGKTFSTPLQMFDYSGGKPKLVTCCPFCNEPVDTEGKDTDSSVTLQVRNDEVDQEIENYKYLG